MITPEALSALRDRLIAATGPDRVLDGDVHEAVTGECVHRSQREEYVWDVVYVCNKCGKEHPKQDWPRYSASIDVALGLVTRLLPGAIWQIHHHSMVPSFAGPPHCSINHPRLGGEIAGGDGATVPLAILTALVSALSQPGVQS